jgi:hypothetical protein
MKAKFLVATAVMCLFVPITVQAHVDWDNPSGVADNFNWANGRNTDTNLFGSPSYYGGGNLYFNNSSFVTYANDGSTSQSVTDTLDVDLTAHTDKKFLSVAVYEYGSYSITGGAENAVSATLDMSGTVAGHPMSPFGDAFVFDASGQSGGVSDWNNNASLLLEFAVPDVTELHLTVSNTLVAVSDGVGGTASITGDFVLLGVSVTVIPEPTSFALLALGGLALTRRPKR